STPRAATPGRASSIGRPGQLDTRHPRRYRPWPLPARPSRSTPEPAIDTPLPAQQKRLSASPAPLPGLWFVCSCLSIRLYAIGVLHLHHHITPSFRGGEWPAAFV